ncbi:hypothetical protein [Streptomyces albipurpureus]|uniref:Uncharacterized protein n=1 Tax=Streptomyces albipurpureus TaxID=2897419 RepID=A0ABT0V0E2_9ACTN|nr:hypothetical protein [Streptomyces sp. CWNU-1]MCM2394312.1 hypothetical protein [Streptomyces sp. CWNU-1]
MSNDQPEITDLGAFGDQALRADTQQQQQQQQQQAKQRSVNRSLDPETSLPQEEVVETLTTEVRQVNTLAPSEGRRYTDKPPRSAK